MRLSVIYITGRRAPLLEWTLDDLKRDALPGDEIELIVIDFYGRSARELGAPECILITTEPHTTIDIRTSKPKPSIWQGEHKIVTSGEWWGISNARNTGIALATYDYIAFVDDRSHLAPGWLEVVREGERERKSVIAGTYDKHANGTITHDSRRKTAPHGKINCGGSWLYGCTSALPLAWALEVNGFEEGCDGMGAEDYTFGLMLANCGRRIDFSTRMKIDEERSLIDGDLASDVIFRRTDKGVSPNDKSHAALLRFGARKRTEFTPDLTALREGEEFAIPDPTCDYRDWYDGQLIREM